MEHIGIDVHKNESQICRLTEHGEVIEKRIATRRDRLASVLGPLPRARILIEASTESEWVARCLEELGHEVIVADPNFAPMYASRNRRVKTDRRDAQTLMDACRLGACALPPMSADRRLRNLAEDYDDQGLLQEAGGTISSPRTDTSCLTGAAASQKETAALSV